MLSDVKLCNLALSHLGGKARIASLAEASEEARQCALHYEPARDEALRALPWPFASKHKPLAALDEPAAPGWTPASLRTSG